MAIYYFNSAVDTNWGTLGNWWLDPNYTLSASELPGPSDDVIDNGSSINFFDGVNVDVNSILLDGGAYFDPMEGSSYEVKANNFIFLNGSGVNFMSLTGDCLFYQSYEDGGNNITGNVTLSGTNTTQSTTTINGNLIIYYPTIAGDLSLPTVNGTTTLVNYKFEEYPYNFTISGLSDPDANVFYGYIGFYNERPEWRSLNGVFEVYRFGDNRWYIESNVSGWGLVSDQENVDYPWNVTSWSVDSEVISGTPVFNLVPFNKSNIIVSGIGDSGVEGLDLNGEYVLGYRGFGSWWGDVNEEQIGVNYGRPFYVKTNGSINYEDWTYIIAYEQGGLGGLTKWYIYNDNVSGNYLFENADSPLAYYPTDISSWTPTAPPVTGPPVLTFASSQNTFGLPADVVALIVSRFGSVANFLRLRNQGQV